MTFALLYVSYLLAAVLLFVIWRRQDKFPDVLDTIDVIFITLTVLLWPVTLSILAWMLYANSKD